MRSLADPDVAAVLSWWDAERRELPWRATRDVYAVWVAEVMSQQTSATRAAEYWERWIARWPTVGALADASLADVLGAWQGLGYPRRARDLHRGAAQVVAGGWPEDLTALAGVGPYTAAAIACFALEQPVLPPDVNVRRVLARRFPEGIDTSGDAWRAGQALMEFGQRVCRARPRCEACVVREGCAARGGDADPAPRRRPQARFQGSLRERRGALLRRVLHDGGADRATADEQAAAGLLADGLLREADGRLLPPR